MVEYLHPGVYVTEIPFHAQPIDGVSTATTSSNGLHAAARDAQLPSPPAPDWTQHNPSDPGITLAQLLAWLADSSLFGMQLNPSSRLTHTQSGRGVVDGLALTARAAGGTATLTVSPGLAIAVDGRPCASDSGTSAHRARKP